MTFGSYSKKLTVDPMCSKAKDVAVHKKNAAMQRNCLIGKFIMNIRKA